MSRMNRLSTDKRTQILAALVEGNSIRATCRMTGAAKNTVANLLRDIGKVCADYQDRVLRDLPCRRIQCDEIWSFCYKKQKNVRSDEWNKWYGDVWTFVGIDADTKLVPCWLVGLRHAGFASPFMDDLASRLRYRVQLTTDGHAAYLDAVEGAFGDQIDYAMLVKLYGPDPAGKNDEKRYSPAKCNGTKLKVIAGNPDSSHISTSYAERQNLTMRMSMRRFTRLTNGFSKKLENLEHAVALHFMQYNFCRVHQTLKTTPAMAAGVADHVWKLEEVVRLLDKAESN